MIKKRLLPALGLAATLLGATLVPASNVAAKTFPDRNVTVIIPFQPGDTDNMLRPFLDRMKEFLDQTVVVNYKPGAGGAIGAQYIANQKPDGYELVGTSPGSIVVVPLANKDVQYSFEDFAPVAALTEGALMLVAPTDSKWKTLEDLIEDAKNNPGDITFSSSGAMGITHLLAEAFLNEAELEMTHVAYQGSGPAITAVLGGHVDISATAIGPAQGHIKSGTLRPLAVFGDERMDAYPDVPTVKELGYDVGSPTLYGLLAPKDTPRERIDIIVDAINQVNDKYKDEISEQLLTLGAQIHVLGPDDYAAYLAQQNELFERAVQVLDSE